MRSPQSSLLIPALVINLAAFSLFSAPAAEFKDNQTALSFKQTVSKSQGYDYLLFLPKGYDAKAGKQWPLILFLHGAGERGTNIWLVSVHGPPKLVKPVVPPPNGETAEARADRETASKLLSENFIVVSPQCPADTRWDNELLLALLDHIIASHKVDTRRVYLTGLSMGGYGTWSLGCRHPDRFAALAPICGGGERIDILIGSRQRKAALQSIGIWAFHGGKDNVVPPEESENMVNALKKTGVKDIQLTVYPEAGHDSWSAAYSNPKLYEWFLQHQR